ncbi:response regulator transcription factor [Mesorhizobium sp. M7A.F.Ca.US.011.01.1.1]|uniref:response regulator transcription factor n=1 Tax=Mesorhizobium sp. M7A.F.Ca.US.011.01.1.1 TaxID=2496741 RepID=UPI000FC9A71B|nr:response regulator transcription factor [Mesorhizobium sp. M7A.F.Ca.US.011.01.1.1]RUX31506.1 response regulator transcription factor [Mesorhizobium sp. M7A.F.Ca.US.011.01.1.1]
MTHILIVEDEPRLRKDLADFLELTGFTAEGVATAAELRQTLANGSSPAVIILDVGLPDGNGFDLATEIRKSHACGIIMLTALGDSDDRIRGFESGADIYLVKHSTLREIDAAIRSLLRRTGAPPDSANGSSDQWVLDGTNWMLIAPNHRSLKLTAAEFAFMNVLCNRSGEICQREDLVELVARPRSNFDNRHLDAVVSRLRRKLEEHISLPAPIKVVYGVGYIFTAAAAVQ